MKLRLLNVGFVLFELIVLLWVTYFISKNNIVAVRIIEISLGVLVLGVIIYTIIIFTRKRRTSYNDDKTNEL